MSYNIGMRVFVLKMLIERNLPCPEIRGHQLFLYVGIEAAEVVWRRIGTRLSMPSIPKFLEDRRVAQPDSDTSKPSHSFGMSHFTILQSCYWWSRDWFMELNFQQLPYKIIQEIQDWTFLLLLSSHCCKTKKKNWSAHSYLETTIWLLHFY